MPISRVRSVTDTSMMFMMPMPPTSSDTAATAPRSPVRRVVVDGHGIGDLRHVADGEVVLLAGADAAPLAQDRLRSSRLHPRDVAALGHRNARSMPMRVLPAIRR